LDIYQFSPIKLKRDKNKSESLYYIMNSNMRGNPGSKEESLKNLKEDNDRKHLSKIMTLIAIKIEEKFNGLAKAFLFFDMDGDQHINKNEFLKGLEGLRVKLSKFDGDAVFEFMDQDNDQCLNYKEFCGFAEEKRRNIDPFDSIDNKQRVL
jgi:Ca2+-binding EF-hand superfamily protein